MLTIIEGEFQALRRLHQEPGKPKHAAHAVLSLIFSQKLPREILSNIPLLELLKKVPPEAILQCTHQRSKGTTVSGYKCPLLWENEDENEFWIVFFPQAESPEKITEKILYPTIQETTAA